MVTKNPPTPPLQKGGLGGIFELVKFPHTLFALPFALSAMLVAARGRPSLKTFLLILAAMVTARTSAMAFNRWADADIDAQNPRTASRHIPQGLLTRGLVLSLALASGLLFLLTTYFINALAFCLAPVALLVICGYSWMKRFTSFSQLILGLSLGIAPMGAWIATTGSVAIPPLYLSLGVLFWAAGFDIIYATQDYDFDRQRGLYSLVVRLGINRALQTARIFHLLALLLFILFGFSIHLGKIYDLTLGLVGLALWYEHRLVKPNDLSRVNAAFFTANGVVALFFLIGTLSDLFLNF